MLGQRFVMHSVLSVGRQGALAHADKVLLRQGEHMVCGHHCKGWHSCCCVVSRDALYEDEPDERFVVEVCAIGQSRYFTGCSATQLKEQFAPSAEQVHCRPLRRDVEARTIAVESDHKALVRYRPATAIGSLAVGVMYADGKPHSAFDPLMEAVPLTPWNALLTFGSKRLQGHQCPLVRKPP